MTDTRTARTTRTRTRSPWLVLVVVLAATFMQLLDVSIVAVAIDSIQTTLGASYADTQLVLVGYQIGFAASLILAARLGDIYGRRRLFLTGMAAFTATSVLCGLAPSIDVLLLARVLQGVSSALMFAQVLAVIQVLFAPKDRAAALGAYGTTIGLGTVLGPVAGGALIQADLVADAWRPIFLVNVPVGLAALLGALLLLPESTAPRRPQLDVLGGLLSATGIGAVLYALAEGRSRGWPLWLLGLLVAGVLVLGAFVAYEKNLSRAGRDPVLDLRLFADRAFRVGALINVVFYAGVPGFFLVFSIYLQAGQGFSALATGLSVLGYSVGAAVTASSADGLAVRLGNRVLSLGAGLLVLGMLLLIATAALVGTSPHVWSWIPGMAVSGLGFGLFVPTIIDLVLVNVDRASAGAASGSLATLQQLGGAIGVAVLGILFFGLLSGAAPGAAANAAPPLRAALTSQLGQAQAEQAVATFTRCFAAQARSSDPTATPPGCQAPPTSGPIADAYQQAAASAASHSFASSLTRSLWFQVALYLLVLTLVTRLPSADQRRLVEHQAA